MIVQLFADESKRRQFTLAVVEAEADRVKTYRKRIKRHLLPGQERLHFKHEKPGRRAEIWNEIHAWSIRIHIIVSAERYEAEARNVCLWELTRCAPELRANLIVVERDQSRYAADRHTLTSGLRGTGIAWQVQEAKSEPMLWAADAAAWLWTHPDAHWRSRVAPFVDRVTRL